MFWFAINFSNKRNEETGNIDASIKKIRNGDSYLREKLIEDFKPFILKAISGTLNKYVDIHNSEEFSIGLLAFNQAIDTYDPQRNKDFLYYASMVIKSRIIDYQRKNKKDSIVYPFTFISQKSSSDFEEELHDVNHINQFESIEIKEQLQSFKDNLKLFNIDIWELVTSSPKHKDSKKLYIKIARQIAENDELFKKLNRTKNLPMNDLMKIVAVHRRSIEKHRKFIIATSLVFRSKLDILKDFVNYAENGGGDFD